MLTSRLGPLLPGDLTINFQEFIAGVSTFTRRAKQAEKTRFSFRMYDFNGTSHSAVCVAGVCEVCVVRGRGARSLALTGDADPLAPPCRRRVDRQTRVRADAAGDD